MALPHNVLTCLICREPKTVETHAWEAGWSDQGLFCTNNPRHWTCAPCLAQYICSGCEGLQADVEGMVYGGPGGTHISHKGALPCPLFKPGECECGQMPPQRLCAFFGVCSDPLVGQAMARYFEARDRVAVEAQLESMRLEEETRKTLQARAELAYGLVTTGITRGHQVPCPICGMAWHKDDACMHMTCRRCQERFCYICGRISSDEGCPPGRGCDRTSSLLEHNEPWEGLTGQEALTLFQIALVRFHLGLARLLVGPLMWEEVMAHHINLLRDVIPGHSFEPHDIKTLAEPPMCGLSVTSTCLRQQETFRRQCEVLGALLPHAVSLWNLNTSKESLDTWIMDIAGVLPHCRPENEEERDTSTPSTMSTTDLALPEHLTSVQIHTLRVVYTLTTQWTHWASYQTNQPCLPSPQQALAVLQDVSWDAIRALEQLRNKYGSVSQSSDPALLGVSPEEQIAANDILAVWQDGTDFLVVSGVNDYEDGPYGLNGRYWRSGVHNNRSVFQHVMGHSHIYWSHGMWRLSDCGGWSEWRFAIRSMALLPPLQNQVWTEEGHEAEGLFPHPHATGPTVSLLTLLDIEQDLLEGLPHPPILRLTRVYTPNPLRGPGLFKPPLTYDFIPLDVCENGQCLRYKRRGMPEYIEYDIDMDMWRLKAPLTQRDRSESISPTKSVTDDDIHPDNGSLNESLASTPMSVTPPEGSIGLHLQHGPQEDRLAHLSLGYQLPPRGLWTWDGHEPSEHHPPLALLECVMWDEISEHPAPLAISVSNAGQGECNGVYVPVAVGRRHTPVYLKRGAMPLTLLQQSEGHWQIIRSDGVPLYSSGCPRHATTFYPPEGQCWHLTQIFQKLAPDKVSWSTTSWRPLVEYIMHEAPSCAASRALLESAVGRAVRLLPQQISRPFAEAMPYAPWTQNHTVHMNCLGLVVDLNPINIMKVAFPTLLRPLLIPAAGCTFHTTSPLAASYPLEVWVFGAGVCARASTEGQPGSLDGAYRHTLEYLCGKPIYRNMTTGALIYFKCGQWRLSSGSITVGWFYAPSSTTHFYDPPGGPWEADAPAHVQLKREACVHVVRPVEVTVTATTTTKEFGWTGQYRQTNICHGRPCYMQLLALHDRAQTTVHPEEPYMIWWNPQGQWQLGLKASGRVMFFCRSWHAEPPASNPFTEWIPCQWDSGAISVSTLYLTQADIIERHHGSSPLCTNTLVRLRPAAVTREIVKAYTEHMTVWDKEHLEACGRVGRIVHVTDTAMAVIQFDHPRGLRQMATRRLLFPVACCMPVPETEVGPSLSSLRDKLGPNMVERVWVQVLEREPPCLEMSELAECTESAKLLAGSDRVHALQGFYRVCGIFMDHPKYRHEKSEGILYFLDTWKLHYEDDVSQWTARAPFVPDGASTCMPPVHGWLSHEASQNHDEDVLDASDVETLPPLRTSVHNFLTITVSPSP